MKRRLPLFSFYDFVFSTMRIAKKMAGEVGRGLDDAPVFHEIRAAVRNMFEHVFLPTAEGQAAYMRVLEHRGGGCVWNGLEMVHAADCGGQKFTELSTPVGAPVTTCTYGLFAVGVRRCQQPPRDIDYQQWGRFLWMECHLQRPVRTKLVWSPHWSMHMPADDVVPVCPVTERRFICWMIIARRRRLPLEIAQMIGNWIINTDHCGRLALSGRIVPGPRDRLDMQTSRPVLFCVPSPSYMLIDAEFLREDLVVDEIRLREVVHLLPSPHFYYDVPPARQAAPVRRHQPQLHDTRIDRARGRDSEEWQKVKDTKAAQRQRSQRKERLPKQKRHNHKHQNRKGHGRRR